MTGVAADGRRVGAGAVVAAVLLPPLGVWLSEGVTANFWIAAVLTLLAFVPGMVFALVAVLRPDILPAYR